MGLLGVSTLVAYLTTAALIALTARWLDRPIATSVLAFLVVLPLVLLYPDLLLDGTRLPTDQTRLDANGQALSGPRNPWLSDIASQLVPASVAVRRSWLAGELPLRDRWNGCGSPLLAAGQPSAFSPLTIIGLPLPYLRAFGLAAAIRALAALIGMWLWLRELRLRRASSLLGAVSFGLSFSIIPWVFFPLGGAVAVWPLVFFGVERLRDSTGNRRAVLFLLATLVVWPLLGHVESVVLGASLLALVLTVRWACGDLPDAPRLLKLGAAVSALAFAIDAFALLPQALAILASNRRVLAGVPAYSHYFSWVPHGFIWPGWRTTFFPRAFGDGIESPMIPGRRAAFTEMSLGYIGIVGWSLALLVLRPGSRRARITFSLVATVLVAHCVGLGAWPFAEIAGHLPLVRWMVPVRFLSWAAFGGSALAALELDRLLKDVPSSRLMCFGATIGTVGFLALLAVETQNRFYWKLGAPAGFPSQLWALRLTLWCLLAFVVCASLVVWLPASVRPAAAFLLVLVAVAESLIQANQQYTVGKAADVFPATPLAAFLQDHTGGFRIAGDGYSFPPRRNVIIGLEDVRTHDPVERRDYVEFLNSTCGFPPAEYMKPLISVNAPALDFLNVRYLVGGPQAASPGDKWSPAYAGPDGTVFENTRVLPRVFAPRRIEGISGTAPHSWIRSASVLFADSLTKIAGLRDFGEKALVLGAAAGERSNRGTEISNYRESTNRVSFHYRAKGVSSETILVSSLVQDGGWQARNGSGKIWTTLANGPFLALRLPDDEGDVVLDYRPPGWRFGMGISATALVLGFALTLRPHLVALGARSA